MRFDIADICENDLLETFGEEVFQRLLRDHSTFAHRQKQGEDMNGKEDECHIIWATSDYAERGEGYGEKEQITIEKVTGENNHLIVPRAVKSRELQKLRTQDKAEVFTPSWVCNAQNNLVDEAWFGRKNVFNTTADNDKTWTPTTDKITFPTADGKTWQDYVSDTRLEITCGEAPYLVSRYDTASGEHIPIENRIGMLDRKLRVVTENCTTESDWLTAARKALQSTYGYEWQGDNLLLARENVFVTMIEYYQKTFGEDRLPDEKELLMWAYITSWNIFQMDGLKMVVPMSCHDEIDPEDIFGETILSCEGCEKDNHFLHNGIYAMIREWPALGVKGAGKKLRFVDLLKQKKS